MSFSELKSPVILDIPADPASLFMVRALVGKVSEKLGFDPGERNKLVLAVDEACTNVIRHAYGNNFVGRIVLTFLLKRDQLEIRIRDFGKAADPATFQPRKLDEVRPGGLGIHFIRSAVDHLQYETPPEGGTLLRMIKFRSGQEASQS